MSTAQTITTEVKRLPLGEPFATTSFLKLGSRSAVDNSLSRLVKQGVVERITQGIYIRPKKNRFVGTVKPEINKVIKVIAESNGETIQVHGAEAARRFKLSTQVPTQPIYYTSGSTRTLKIGKLTIKLVHVARRKLQLSEKKSGLALSALWYIGKENMSRYTVEQVCNKLNATEQEELFSAEMPAWISNALQTYQKEYAIG
ncbi:DUF6088 family protein [Oceanicoccus sagamiensis]|uniref:Type IV toxin-antitoxin system AbiEi family antitoxin domain-containing protein n=1 Tax=Oceanicoccus sagamiensis TaxID=716816 RepID=A0A1X9N7K4_9GAMM|nr:DUF6088 family protein [Oceanicoccus sagamiensis]ARN73104.1 hypothetical protein BST96_02670 [Oceanicoccus sagamiensis]